MNIINLRKLEKNYRYIRHGSVTRTVSLDN